MAKLINKKTGKAFYTDKPEEVLERFPSTFRVPKGTELNDDVQQKDDDIQKSTESKKGIKVTFEQNAETNKSLSEMKRPELNQYAIDNGIENPEGFKNKQDLIEAINNSGKE